MKAIVISNCGTASYVAGLKALFPDWEVRGAVVQNVRSWTTTDPNPKFLNYLSECDLLVGLNLADYKISLTLPPRIDIIRIPAFIFRGLHPDAINYAGCNSAIGASNLSSRILLAAFAADATIEQARQLFNDDTYEALGYFDAFEKQKSVLISRFRRFNLEVGDLVDRWAASGCFLHIPEHGKPIVYFDILRRALLGRYLTSEQVSATDALVDNVPDYLSEGAVWPVYPGIAERRGLVGNFEWRRGATAYFEAVSFDDFVKQSYTVIAAGKGFQAEPIPEGEFCLGVVRRLLSQRRFVPAGTPAGGSGQPPVEDSVGTAATKLVASAS